MVCENRNRLGCAGIDQVNEPPHTLRAKVPLVAARAYGIDRNQSYRVILNRIVDKFGAGHKIPACREGDT